MLVSFVLVVVTPEISSTHVQELPYLLTAKERDDISIGASGRKRARENHRRTSLFFTKHDPWMLAADCETMSMSFPSMMISSFWFVDSRAVTPSNMAMFRTICKSESKENGQRNVLHPRKSTEATSTNLLSCKYERGTDAQR